MKSTYQAVLVANLCLILLLVGCSQNGGEVADQEANQISTAGPSASASSSDPVVPTKTTPPDPTDTPEPTSSPVPTDTPEPTETPTPFPEIDLNIELPAGDPLRGRNAAVKYRCYGCHLDSPEHGPPFAASDNLPFILERGEIRIADPVYQGRAVTNLEYVVESIFLPEIYLIPGEWEEAMPTTFLQRMTDQELSNIIAWISSLQEE